MQSSSQDKTLPATARRLDQARKDGQAARSKDLSHIAVLGTGAIALVMLSPMMFEHLKDAFIQQFAFNSGTMMDPASMVKRLQQMAITGVGIASVFAAIVITAAVGSTIAAGGWIASLKPIMPDFNRINPLSGVSNLFSKQQLVNVGKVVLLSACVMWVGWTFVSSSMDSIAQLVLQPSNMAISQLSGWLVKGLTLMLLVILAAALVDVPLQLYFHHSKLRMSHTEVKQEHKESDGNQQTKGRQRSIAKEISQRASITAVPKADFILMNPTHFAVALKYDDKTMNAPHVIAKGADLLAFRIREIAKSHDIPVLQSPMLARALYAHAELDRPIPSTLYTAVAQVLAYIYRLKAAMRGDAPMPDEMPDPYVPPELDPLNKVVATDEADEVNGVDDLPIAAASTIPALSSPTSSTSR